MQPALVIIEEKGYLRSYLAGKESLDDTIVNPMVVKVVNLILLEMFELKFSKMVPEAAKRKKTKTVKIFRDDSSKLKVFHYDCQGKPVVSFGYSHNFITAIFARFKKLADLDWKNPFGAESVTKTKGHAKVLLPNSKFAHLTVEVSHEPSGPIMTIKVISIRKRK